MQTTIKKLSILIASKLQKNQIFIFTIVVVALLMIIEPAYAGPGGFVAKGLFKTWWGKILIIALGIILSPLIIYIRLREYIAVKKNKQILLKLGQINNDFKWYKLEKDVRNIFGRVYVAWSKENMEEVSSYVSSWYWQNQQLVFLDEWKNKNLRNICNLQEIGKINPLHLEITDEDNLEGSIIAFSISANVEDYLVNRKTGNVVYGRRGFENERKIWFLEYTDGKWLLDDIREGNLSLTFAKLKNIIPEQLLKQSIQNKTQAPNS